MAKNKQFINSVKAFYAQLEQTTEAVYASLGIALYEMGFSQEDIAEAFELSQEIWDKHESNIEGMIKKCEDETGLCIKPKKEGS